MALASLISNKLPSKCKQTTIKFTNWSGFLEDAFADVTITVSHVELCSESKTYKLHRIVLAGRSSVLHEWLKLHQTLDITYMSPAEFELLIVYFYTGVVCFESVSELCFAIFAAKKFNIMDLFGECSERLRKKLKEDCDNALLILQFDERFEILSENKTLLQIVDETIRENYSKCLNSEVIEHLEENTLKHLMQMEMNTEISEIEVFRSLLKWTYAFCSKSGKEQIPKHLQEVAGDLIYLVRYNLIPVEILATEVASSGLLTAEMIALALQRFYNDKLEVPFCTKCRGKIKENDTALDEFDQVQLKSESICTSEDKVTANDKFDDAQRELVSICTSEEHVVSESSQWKTTTNLYWNGRKGPSLWFSISAAAANNTKWEVQFCHETNDDFAVVLRCCSFDEKFQAVSFRLFAVVVENPQIWTEMADVVKSGKETYCFFSEKVYKLSKLNIRIRLQWNEIEKLQSTFDAPVSRPVYIRCRWKMKSWKSVTPTAYWWTLYSESFGRNGTIWRMLFQNNSNESNDRKVMICVILQHLPSSNNSSDLTMNCSLSLWNRNLRDKSFPLKERAFCKWTVIDSINLELRDPLDINVIICITPSTSS